GLAALVGGAGGDGGGPRVGGLGPGVLVDGLVGALGEAGGVVDGAHGDGEGLGRRGVHAAVGGAAVVMDVDRHRGQAVGVGGRGVGEDTGGADRGLGREQGVVVVGAREIQDLAALVGGAGGDGGGTRSEEHK